MYEEKEPVKKEKKVKKEKSKKENKFFQKTPLKESKGKEEKEKIEKVSSADEKKKGLKILSFRADYVSVLIRFGIFLIFAFIVIFIVTKVRNSGDANSFTENMENMKEVAYTYYKVETHRPVSVDEEIVLTLKDLEEASLIKELKDQEGNVCSKEYSYVSLVKTSSDEYDLIVYLSCGGESQMATYPVSFDDSENHNVSTSTLLYEQKRTIEVNEEYSCPEGYYHAGRYCISTNNTVTVQATPKYKVTPARNSAARYKPTGYEYEYVDPIVSINESSYECPSGYTLSGTSCVKEGTVRYRSSTSYSCPNGGTPSGSRCLFTVSANYSDEKPYCRRGTLINNDSCYVTEEYKVRCVTGKKDSTINACYTTYSASEELSDWLFDGKVTYSEDYDIDRLENERRMYEVDEYLDNGKIRYSRYIRKYIKTCDDGDELKGSTCRHYDEAYEQRYCSDSDYHLASDESECFTYEDARYKETSGIYTCPSGYRKRGSGASSSCYKYESATKNTSQTPYCASGYDLTSNGKCVRTIEATLVEEKVTYSCPEGYTKRGNGASTQCYKKTTTDSYYYCTNSQATLNGTRCVIAEKTTFLGYTYSNGYDLSGNQCIKTDNVERILATENDHTTSREEIIWSKEKELDGWTWTGNTKEAE